ncbi:hypothetical protein CF327_g5720 [Tilletia walkeri]|nr:hypothetical protein CF327_g5720 [Tilletia walkeri]
MSQSKWHPGELEVVDDRACLKPKHDVGRSREPTTIHIHGWKRGNFIFPFVLLLPSDAETRPSATDESTADNWDDFDGAELAMQKLHLYAQTAAGQGANLICFPEYFLTGAMHSSWKAVCERQEPVTVALDAVHPNPEEDESHWLAQVAAIAGESDIDIVVGTVVKLDARHIPHRKERRR